MHALHHCEQHIQLVGGMVGDEFVQHRMLRYDLEPRGAATAEEPDSGIVETGVVPKPGALTAAYLPKLF